MGRRPGKYRTVFLPEQPKDREGSVPISAPVLDGMAVCVLHSGSDFADLHLLWQRANDSGVRRMVLQLETESPVYADDDNKLNVRVLHTEHWPDWSSLDAEQTLAVAHVIARWAAVDTFLNATFQKAMEQRNRMGFWFLEDTKYAPIADPEQMNLRCQTCSARHVCASRAFDIRRCRGRRG